MVSAYVLRIFCVESHVFSPDPSIQNFPSSVNRSGKSVLSFLLSLISDIVPTFPVKDESMNETVLCCGSYNVGVGCILFMY